jgi:hypothetical protein
MIQSILAEISQKRRIHLYPSLARDESLRQPCQARPDRLWPALQRLRHMPATAVCYYP